MPTDKHDVNELITYSNQLRLKNMEHRAREAKQLTRIKQLEEQVASLESELTTSEESRLKFQKKCTF